MKRTFITALSLFLTFLSFAQVNHLVISQVYGGGGNAGSVYKNDFIEIFNPTTSSVSLSGWSVQYASATGTSWTVTTLSGSIAPGQYYLVQEAVGAGGTTNLPGPDATGTIAMSGTAAKVALVSSTTALSGSCPAASSYVDFVGFGTTANCYEGTGPTPAPSNTNSVIRANGGCTDANNNSADFTAATAAPRYSGSPFNFCTANNTCGPTNIPSTLNLTPAQTSVSGSFGAAPAGTTNATGYIVLATTANYLTELPVNNAIYNVGDDLGNAKVVAFGTGTSFTATGLSSGTAYNFFVYAYSASGCYNTGAQLTAATTTLTPPPCTPPTTGVSNVAATPASSSQINLTYTRGNGDAVLILYHAGSAVTATPVNGTAYAAGDQLGTGDFVAYNGTSASAPVTGLQANTQYYFTIYEYTAATNCYVATAATISATTACGNPPPVTAFNGSGTNGVASLTWTNPVASGANGTCYDDILIVASTSPITGNGQDYTGTANTVFTAPGPQVVYRGTGTAVSITGLTNGVTYYFREYSRFGSVYTPLANAPQITVTPFDASSGYMYLYGNLHAHSSYSDGNKENTAKTPKDDFEYARDAECMDFLGISEHNHTGAGMNYPDFTTGYNQANQVNLVASPLGNSIVTLWGMEWGVSSTGGGHVLIYGFDNQLIGWEAGQYDIFCAKNDYASLWPIINARANAFAALAHPGSSDYGNLLTAYDNTADNALYGVAVESGPALTNATDYNTKPASLGFLGYYKSFLAKGYHAAPQMDQDNHYMTFGTINRNRMVVLATDKTRTAITDAIRNMRFYASEDCNARVDYKCGTNIMGSSVVSMGLPSLSINVVDNTPNPTTIPSVPESVSTIDIWAGQVGVGNGVLIKSYSNQSSITFNSSDVENTQPNNTTWYYYAIITQGDGDKMVTAPIWYSRQDGILPVTLVSFKAQYNAAQRNVLLTWATAQELNSKEFIVERSADNGNTWLEVGTVQAAGNSSTNRSYHLTDGQVSNGVYLYRLKQIDLNLGYRYAQTVQVNIGKEGNPVYMVYPNPARGLVYVSSTSNAMEKAVISFIDLNGKELSRKEYLLNGNSRTAVSLAGLPSGVYFVRISNGKASVMEKLVVQQ